MSRRYLEDVEYRLNSELNKIRELIAEPNRSYALGYRDHLELNNRKYRTIARRLGELRYMLVLLGNVDAKKATRTDMEGLFLIKGTELVRHLKPQILDLRSRMFLNPL